MNTTNAAMFIDLENFYRGRRDFANEELNQDYSRDRFYTEFCDLLRFARDISGTPSLPLRVARAYADFNYSEFRGFEDHLMELAVTPIHLPRFPGSPDKNAADIQLSLDALTLVQTAPRSVGHIILVAGDSDYIPLVVKIRECGTRVSLIGPDHQSTKPLFRAHCDRFDLFDDLKVAADVRAETEEGQRKPVLATIRDILARVLQNRPRISVRAAARLMMPVLQTQTASSLLSYSDVLDLLCNYAADLNIHVLRLRQRAYIVSWVSKREQLPTPHTAQHYRRLLQEGIQQQFFLILTDEWLRISDAIFMVAPKPNEEALKEDDFDREVLNRCVTEELPEVMSTMELLQAVKYQLKATNILQEVYRNRGAFYKLREEFKGVEELRRTTRVRLILKLRERLRLKHNNEEVQLVPLAEMFEGPDCTNDQLREVAELLEGSKRPTD